MDWSCSRRSGDGENACCPTVKSGSIGLHDVTATGRSRSLDNEGRRGRREDGWEERSERMRARAGASTGAGDALTVIARQRISAAVLSPPAAAAATGSSGDTRLLSTRKTGWKGGCAACLLVYRLNMIEFSILHEHFPASITYTRYILHIISSEKPRLSFSLSPSLFRFPILTRFTRSFPSSFPPSPPRLVSLSRRFACLSQAVAGEGAVDARCWGLLRNICNNFLSKVEPQTLSSPTSSATRKQMYNDF